MARHYQLKRPTGGSGIDYPAALNAEQYAAVSSPPGKALVIAGAGSGKTRTLTYRVAWLLDQGVESRNASFGHGLPRGKGLQFCMQHHPIICQRADRAARY